MPQAEGMCEYITHLRPFNFDIQRQPQTTNHYAELDVGSCSGRMLECAPRVLSTTLSFSFHKRFVVLILNIILGSLHYQSPFYQALSAFS